MKLGLLFCVFMVMNGCALIHKTSQSQNTETPKKYIEDAPRDRRLVLNGVAISESDLPLSNLNSFNFLPNTLLLISYIYIHLLKHIETS